jgi:hypothetical protein
MDQAIYDDLKEFCGWRFANAQRDSLALMETEMAGCCPISNDAESSSSNSGSAFNPSPSSGSSSLSSSSSSGLANSRGGGDFPDFFISERAAQDKNLLLLRRYRGALRCLDCGDLVSSARIAPLLRKDAALFYCVSTYFNDPFMAEDLDGLLQKFWRGGYHDAAQDGPRRLHDGEEHKAGKYPDVELLRLIYEAVEKYEYQEIAHDTYQQKDTSFALLLDRFYEKRKWVPKDADTPLPPRSVSFNPTWTWRYFRKNEAAALKHVREVREAVESTKAGHGVLKGKAALECLRTLKVAKSGNLLPRMTVAPKANKRTKFGVVYDPGLTPYVLLNKNRTELCMRLKKGSSLHDIKWTKEGLNTHTVADVVPFCPDAKKVLLHFEQTAAVAAIEDYYGISIFMLAAHVCQLSTEGHYLSTLPEASAPSCLDLLDVIDKWNKATNFNPTLPDAFAVLFGEKKIPECDGSPARRKPSHDYSGSLSGKSESCAGHLAEQMRKRERERVTGEGESQKRTRTH